MRPSRPRDGAHLSIAQGGTAVEGGEERPLTRTERKIVGRLLDVLPPWSSTWSRADLSSQLETIRVRNSVEWVDGRPGHALVVLDEAVVERVRALPVRGFSVDGAGAPVGEVVVWVDGDRLIGFRHQALSDEANPSVPPLARLDPECVDAVPWPGG